MLIAVVLPIAAAVSFSLSHLFVRLGMDESNPSTAVAVNVAANGVGLWVLAMILSPIRPLASWGVWPFAVAGIFAPSLARTFLFHGYKHMGMARSDVITGSVPIFSVAMAVSFLGERPSPIMFLGTAGIVVGIGLLSYRPNSTKPWSRWAVLLPLGAAFCFSLREILSKMGLARVPVPIGGAALMATVAAVVLYLSFLLPGTKAPFTLTRRSLFLFSLGGLMVTVAYACVFTALRSSMVSLVSPLLGTQPLYSLLFSFLFLQSTERVTGRVVLGGLLVVAGAAGIILVR
ncbi:MAG: DMT family transporter [Nitrospinota bacterium]